MSRSPLLDYFFCSHLLSPSGFTSNPFFARVSRAALTSALSAFAEAILDRFGFPAPNPLLCKNSVNDLTAVCDEDNYVFWAAQGLPFTENGEDKLFGDACGWDLDELHEDIRNAIRETCIVFDA